MFNSRAGRRLAVTAAVVIAAIGSAAPAHAGGGNKPADCDERLERLEAKFYVIEERRGYEAATEWWDARWQAYYKRCLAP